MAAQFVRSLGGHVPPDEVLSTPQDELEEIIEQGSQQGFSVWDPGLMIVATTADLAGVAGREAAPACRLQGPRPRQPHGATKLLHKGD